MQLHFLRNLLLILIRNEGCAYRVVDKSKASTPAIDDFARKPEPMHAS